MKAWQILLATTLVILGYFMFVAEVGAVVVFRDDFSDGTLEQWQMVRGNSAHWEVRDEILVGMVTSASSISELIPVERVWNSRWGNYRMSVDMMPMRGVDRNIAWNYQDPRNWYEAHFVGNLVELYRLREGSTGFVSGHQFFLSPFEWHHVVIEVLEQTMRLWVDGWLVAEVTDWFADGRAGTIALKVGAGAVAPSEVWFDNVTVELLASERDTKLDLTKFRQDDEAWAADEYDHGTAWSAQPTIERWGCALSAAAMVLRYHGFTFLPDGGELDPSSLNQWLRSQPDGYIADGWVNWLAVERLTRLLVRDLLPGLQPIRVKSIIGLELAQLWQISMSELLAGRPVVVALANHFMAAVGSISNQQDILVHDPWYLVETLGQHELVDRALRSVRLFEPYTLNDRAMERGWLVAMRGVNSFRLLDVFDATVEIEWQEVVGPERGGEVFTSEINTVNERLETDGSEWRVWWLPIPPVGKYQLVMEATDQSAEIQWYAYGLEDVVSMKIFANMPNPHIIKVEVNETGETVWSEHAEQSWQTLLSWWEQQENRLPITGIEGWLRIHYLMRAVIRQAVFDPRQEQLVLKTIQFYRQQSSNELLIELERRFRYQVMSNVDN